MLHFKWQQKPYFCKSNKYRIITNYPLYPLVITRTSEASMDDLKYENQLQNDIPDDLIVFMPIILDIS